ncbi:MAG: Rpn family recombination-promoting nuclease/putative transposase [Duncaniella sp.]|nr:Rpn family recombination-promoting nuclease/putative transposase [Duncaniella sp.]
MSKYLNPFTDVGFKRIFGQEMSKDILISFLNALLEGEHVITDLTFLDKERVPILKSERGLVYDIYCTTDTGEHIIVEMQNKYQKHFRDRAVYYASTDIAWQAVKGSDWKYELTPVYGVYFMNFKFNEPDAAKPRTDVALMDMETGKIFSDKIRLIFLQLPLFDLTEEECDTDFKKWLYVLNNMQTFDRMPFAAQKAVFDRLGSIAEIANMPRKERWAYEESLRIYRDTIAIVDTAREEGEEKGMEKGIVQGENKMLTEVVHSMREKGMDNQAISYLLNKDINTINSID